jgi:transposase
MIAVPAGIRVLVTKPVDLRRGADSLVALMREQLKHDPFSGTIFVFRSERADRLKIVAWDGSGLMLFWKRLAQGASLYPLLRHFSRALTHAGDIPIAFALCLWEAPSFCASARYSAASRNFSSPDSIARRACRADCRHSPTLALPPCNAPRSKIKFPVRPLFPCVTISYKSVARYELARWWLI